MRSLPVLLAALLAVGAAGCGSSSQTGAASSTAHAPAPAPAPPAASPTSPVSVLAAGVTVTRRSVAVDLRLRQPADADPPTARTAELTLPAGSSWHGGAAPSCSPATIRKAGAQACPRGSILGAGTSTGLADRSVSTGQITVVNGGPGTILLATVIRNPAYVKSVVTGRIAMLPGGGLRVALRFPAELQTIAGVPVGLQRLRLAIDRGRVLVTKGCGGVGARAYRATVAFVDGTHVDRAGTASCRGR
jgi:hypothetical protein